ncbi:MAG: hypothetical protein AB1Z23_01990 [Eubacteriales bacterium]
MATKRMLNKNITESDKFINLSVHSQALYFHLNLKADDEGFVSSPNQMIKMLDLKKEHFDELVEKGFIIAFESGICLVCHWHIHNSIRKDRAMDTIYHMEKEMVCLDSSKAYAMKPIEKGQEEQAEEKPSIPLGMMSAQKREEENRKDENRTEKPRQAAMPATVCDARLNEILKDESILPRAQTIRALGKYMKSMDFECIEYAIDQSRQWNKQSVGYVCAILDRLLAQGVKTREQLASEVKIRHGPNAGNANQGMIGHGGGDDYYEKIFERAEEL